MAAKELEARLDLLQEQIDQLYSWHGRKNLLKQRAQAKLGEISCGMGARWISTEGQAVTKRE
jgi:hypothetical protein